MHINLITPTTKEDGSLFEQKTFFVSVTALAKNLKPFTSFVCVELVVESTTTFEKF